MSHQADVALLAPHGPPGVANGPVANAASVAVAYQNHRVVNIDVFSYVAEVRNAALIGAPARSVHGNRLRAMGHECLHKGHVVVGRVGDEASNAGHGVCSNMHFHLFAALLRATPEGFVAHDLLISQGVVHHILKANLCSSAITTTGATAVTWILGARDHGLRCQDSEGTFRNGHSTLYCRGRCESPARSAVALILHWGHHVVFITPIEGDWKL
mmetsp:Transcript_36185/g.59253  ORF Transcript_36185/g.59253 Transcript_36185/m.59253 type:complete len:214 (-) Transcript_36185:125-766(-)